MKKEWADKWIEALESNKYKQGYRRLCILRDKERFYCCLGVLSKEVGVGEERVIRKHSVGIADIITEDIIAFENETSFLPKKVQDITGIKSNDGSYKDITLTDSEYLPSSLSISNDIGQTFVEIAQIIRRHWKEL